jgi:hypothetical protein
MIERSMRPGASLAFAGSLLLAAAATASTPASHDVTVPTQDGQTVVVEWTGTALPNNNSTSSCTQAVDPSADPHAIALTVPPGAYDAAEVEAVVHIEWDDDLQDLILTVLKDGVEVRSADGGTPEENISLANPAGGSYNVVVCSFLTVLPTAYRAKLTLKAIGGADEDGDGVRGVHDNCPGTPPDTNVDDKGCATTNSAYGQVGSDAGRPRVVVSDLDSGINPYHAFFYSQPSQVTTELLAELGVKPRNVVKLTRTGNFAADVAADAKFWKGVKRGELYHFVGTNIVAVSFAPPGTEYLKPMTSKSAHGVGTASSVLDANPEAVLLFVESHTALGTAEIHDFAFTHPAVDIVTTSYGVSFAPGGQNTGVPQPEYRAFESTFEGVVGNGKLHFSSGGNGPAATFLRAGAGPWWSIGVTGFNEDESDGKEIISGYIPDFVSDFVQDIPYCMNCETGRSSGIAGTSFSTPRAAGVASRVLLEARRQLGHAGGITTVGGSKVMAAAGSRTISNWVLRRALEQAAYVPQATEYSVPDTALPVTPVAPWTLVGWGDLTAAPGKGVVAAALSHLGLGNTPRAKDPGFCEWQTKLIQFRKQYWDTLAPAVGSWTANAYASDPFIYCASDVPAPLHPATNDPASLDGDGDGASDASDNCPAAANASQADFDTDGQGDACDGDDDNDGVADGADAFPLNAAESADTDGDGTGNNADADDDGDGVADADEAGQGTDPLDADTDADGAGDGADNCPLDANGDQADADGDGLGDACDQTGDLTPDAFAFTTRTGVATGVYVASETVALSGFTLPLEVSVTGANSPQYRVNGGAWTAAPGQVQPGDTLAVRHISAATESTASETTVTVGDYGTPFRSVTSAVDRAPDAFSFGAKTGVAPGALVESDATEIRGFNTSISIVPGPGIEYHLGDGVWKNTSGTLPYTTPWTKVTVRHAATTTAGGYTKTYLRIGGVTGYFTTRTQ